MLQSFLGWRILASIPAAICFGCLCALLVATKRGFEIVAPALARPESPVDLFVVLLAAIQFNVPAFVIAAVMATLATSCCVAGRHWLSPLLVGVVASQRRQGREPFRTALAGCKHAAKAIGLVRSLCPRADQGDVDDVDARNPTELARDGLEGHLCAAVDLVENPGERTRHAWGTGIGRSSGASVAPAVQRFRGVARADPPPPCVQARSPVALRSMIDII